MEKKKKKINVMIHSCTTRIWYVLNILVPMLLAQGLKKSDIQIWEDKNRDGNLRSFLKSMQWVKENLQPSAFTFHIQDDVAISRTFVQRIKQLQKQNKIVAGFCCTVFNKYNSEKTGEQPMSNIWFSFPCIGIPNSYAEQFTNWYRWQGQYIEALHSFLSKKRGDDSFFRQFLLRYHFRERGINVQPNLVEHIDYLLGGSVTNKGRDFSTRSCYWHQSDVIQEIQQKIKGFPQFGGISE